MAKDHENTLLDEIDEFLARTGMGSSYFGKKATGNSEVVKRLRNNGRVWPETERLIRNFIANYRPAPKEDAA